ncbi:hypothetical protein BH09PSE6_BH09PSE6_34280 [soil metagenome]
MPVDTILAAVHHLLAFAIVALIATEWAMLTLVVMDPHWIRRVSRLDAAYGIAAGGILLIGTLRVIYGPKGGAFYLSNHAFWAKLAAFALVGVLSLMPTVTIAQWRRSNRLPPPREVLRLRRWLVAELVVFAFIPVFAAMMARGVGY